MRFRLLTLFGIVALSAACVGVAFSASIAAVALGFAALSALSPAALISGIVFGRERLRAFCIGGISSGCLPLVLATGYFLESARQALDWLDAQPGLYRDYSGQLRIGALVALLLPQVLVFAGGFVGMRMRRAFLPTAKPRPADPV